MKKSTLVLLILYIFSSIVFSRLLLGLFALSLIFAALFGSVEKIYLLVFGTPQLILLPIFIYLYRSEQARIKGLVIMFLITLVLGVYLFVSDSIMTNQYNKRSAAAGKIANDISITNYQVSKPQYIQETTPKGWHDGGKLVSVVHITIKSDLFVPTGQTYYIQGTLFDTSTLINVDGINGPSYESHFNLTPGIHKVTMTYEDGIQGCHTAETLKSIWGDEEKPQKVWIEIRLSETPISNEIKDFTYMTYPLKPTDLFAICNQ